MKGRKEGRKGGMECRKGKRQGMKGRKEGSKDFRHVKTPHNTFSIRN